MTGKARSTTYDLVDDLEIAALREVAGDRMRDLEARVADMRRQGDVLTLRLGRLERQVLEAHEAEVERIRALLASTQPC